MNYYKRHIGDYMKDASHLSLLEHGVYMRLLDVYYTREAPIPRDQAARLVGARSKEEREALDTVAAEFFTLQDGHLVQARCDREIAAMTAKAETNRVVGARGGRPKKQTQKAAQPHDSGNPQKTQMVSEKNPEETQMVSEKNPNVTQATSHKPITNTQHTHLVDQEGGGPTGPACASGTLAGAVCKAMKAAGIADTSPGHPTLQALLQAGASTTEFTDAARQAAGKSKGFAYALSIVAGNRKQAAELAGQLHRGELPASETPYQRSMRERVQEFAPSIAKQAPGAAAEAINPVAFFEAIDVTARRLESPQ